MLERGSCKRGLPGIDARNSSSIRQALERSASRVNVAVEPVCLGFEPFQFWSHGVGLWGIRRGIYEVACSDPFAGAVLRATIAVHCFDGRSGI